MRLVFRISRANYGRAASGAGAGRTRVLMRMRIIGYHGYDQTKSSHVAQVMIRTRASFVEGLTLILLLLLPTVKGLAR